MSDTPTGIPSGFTLHDGGDCPVGPDNYVIPIVRTLQGLGYGPSCRAGDQEWPIASHPNGIGAILAYRASVRFERADLDARWPES